jgi:hypothetical protein
MEKQEAIEMLQNLIANIESDHVSIVETKGEAGGPLSWLTLILSGSPQIMRAADNGEAFLKRHNKREKEFAKQAERQRPTQDFLNKSYNI